MYRKREKIGPSKELANKVLAKRQVEIAGEAASALPDARRNLDYPRSLLRGFSDDGHHRVEHRDAPRRDPRLEMGRRGLRPKAAVDPRLKEWRFEDIHNSC